MKRITTLLPGLHVIFNVLGQNIIPNPSFEEYTECPHDYGQSLNLLNWFPAYGSPDLYNACDGNDTCGVPENVAGYQQAATGNGYIGMGCYSNDPPDGFRELLGVRLDQALVPGTTYYVSFKVSWTTGYPNPDLYVRYASNKLGIRLRMNSLVGLDWFPMENIAQMYSDSIVSDSLGWTVLSGHFVADAPYQYMYLGNFFAHAFVQTVVVDPNGPDEYSYYYFDDVCLSSDPGQCPTSTGLDNGSVRRDVGAFVDLSTRTILVNGMRSNASYSVELFDTMGRLLYQRAVDRGHSEWRFALPSTVTTPFVVLRLRDEREEHRFKLLIPLN
jgi:hypothetical protein